MKNTISFPRYGKYTDLFVESFREVGVDVIAPPSITEKTVELGTKYSPGDICYPFKITLGGLIETLEKGANRIIMVNSAGWCLLRCYAVVQERILKDLGYDFEMINMNIRTPLKIYRAIRKIVPSNISAFKIIHAVKKLYNKAKKIDIAEQNCNRTAPIKIGIAGEVYVCNEDTVNMNITGKLQDMNVYVDKWLSLSGNLKLLGKDYLGIKDLKKYRKIAHNYFPERIGGHANENLVKLIKYAETGYDGAILLKPFACNPETIIEPIVEKISKDYGMPILCLCIDESMLETHFQTRLESFIDMIKIRKGLF